MNTTMIFINLGPDIPAREASPDQFWKNSCPDDAVGESFPSTAAKKLNSKSSSAAIEVTRPNNEAKDGGQTDPMNRTGPIKSTNGTSSNFPPKAKETESNNGPRKMADADILAKEKEALSLKKTDAQNVTMNKSTSVESEKGPDVSRNGRGHEIKVSPLLSDSDPGTANGTYH